MERDFTADIPVSVATAAAIAIGEYSSAAVVAVLLLVGGIVEEFVAARAGRAIETLAQLLPDWVTVRRGGRDDVVALGEVRVGDVLLVRPGERIAVDGAVESGIASVNQAAITGESVPVDRGSGDEVFAGTMNEAGALEVRAGKVGEETTLGQIRRMVEEAREEKAPVERLLDRYARFYTPVALVLGALLWWWTGDALRAITMLIVFCPCVMVLATPAERIAAELGIGDVYAEVLPQQKVGVVERLRAEGRGVAFVGDGVNDGPALAAADVGVAMGLSGTDVAIQTADIGLLSDDLSRISHLLGLSRQAIRAIKQNLVFSLGVLGVAVGLTIPGVLTPATGALLHELSSIPVIANSARLIGVRER